MTQRELDRFDKQGKEFANRWAHGSLTSYAAKAFAAALRAAKSEALERAAQLCDSRAANMDGKESLEIATLQLRGAAEGIRALIPPAAAPAADGRLCEPCASGNHEGCYARALGWFCTCARCAAAPAADLVTCSTDTDEHHAAHRLRPPTRTEKSWCEDPVPVPAPVAECPDHWHCDPATAAHACKANRSAPCPTCHAAPAAERQTCVPCQGTGRRQGGGGWGRCPDCNGVGFVNAAPAADHAPECDATHWRACSCKPPAPAACQRCDPKKPGLMWNARLERHVPCTDSSHTAPASETGKVTVSDEEARRLSAFDAQLAKAGCSPVTQGPWRVGTKYGIHVYEGDVPVATFFRAEDARRAVNAQARIAELETALLDFLCSHGPPPDCAGKGECVCDAAWPLFDLPHGAVDSARRLRNRREVEQAGGATK